MKKVLITGATGMVGKGVLLECLESDRISEVQVLNRNPLDFTHPKLKEILLKDFLEVETIKEQVKDIDGCFHCMGISSVGINEEAYTKTTYEITKALVDVLYEINRNMVFNYVSGTGTDGTENGRSMWARVKGKTENYIMNKGFRNTYMFRPGVIIPEKGIKSRTGWYQFLYVLLQPFYPLLKKSKHITTTTRIGQVMIMSLFESKDTKHLENTDINSWFNELI